MEENPRNRAISILDPRVARNGDMIYHAEVDRDSMREDIRLLKD